MRERERAITRLRLWVWELGISLLDSRVSSTAKINKNIYKKLDIYKKV